MLTYKKKLLIRRNKLQILHKSRSRVPGPRSNEMHELQSQLQRLGPGPRGTEWAKEGKKTFR